MEKLKVFWALFLEIFDCLRVGQNLPPKSGAQGLQPRRQLKRLSKEPKIFNFSDF
jgi:hypothetical protein